MSEQQPVKETPKTGALANVDIDAVILRIASGEYQSHIARELGIAPQRMHEVVSKHPAYREALKLRNMTKLDNAQEGLESAKTAAFGADLARAREAFKAAAWRAERECPAEWGNKQEVSGPGGGAIAIEIVRYGSQVLEGQVVRQPIADAEVVQHLLKK